MSEVRLPASFIDEFRALQRRVRDLENRPPCKVGDSTPTEDAQTGELRKVRGGSMYVMVDGSWVVI